MEDFCESRKLLGERALALNNNSEGYTVCITCIAHTAFTAFTACAACAHLIIIKQSTNQRS